MKRTQRTLAIAGALVTALGLGAMSVSASAPKHYVLKHPQREHCKAHYVKRVEIVKKRSHRRLEKVHEALCINVPPQNVTTPASTPTTTITPTGPAPFATTTFLDASEAKGACACGAGEQRTYEVWYVTKNEKGEVAPGDVTIREHVPPSQEERTIAIPAGAEVFVEWEINHGECFLRISVNNLAQPTHACERQNPRVVLVAEYATPASGWLASKSEPLTLK